MENPWLSLPSQAPYVLDVDRDCIQQHNDRLGRQTTRFVAESIPEPFIGNPCSARVVLLATNPGHSEDDECNYRDAAFRNAMVLNLQHKLEEYPFYPLNPEFNRPGAGVWWRKRTRELIDAPGLNAEKVAKGLMVIETFPYHSTNFRRPRAVCESQSYSFYLAKKVLDDGRLVVAMRARRAWTEVDPRFASVPYLENPRCASVSRGNTKGDLFDQIVSALRDDTTFSCQRPT